jgi:hypothetical protein
MSVSAPTLDLSALHDLSDYAKVETQGTTILVKGRPSPAHRPHFHIR